MDVPAEYGGLGLDCLTVRLVREALGYHDAGFACSFSASTFGINPVLLYGNEEQKQYYGKKLAEGVISAQLLTEPQSGSDVANMLTTAVKDGDSYVINGRKTFVTNGGLAGIYTVAAVTAPADPANGKKRPEISLFIVDRDVPGVSVGKEENKQWAYACQTPPMLYLRMSASRQQI
ncbi:MAG: acyl-CoA dehydrogenase family protein [Oscillospiraceae bacterium]